MCWLIFPFEGKKFAKLGARNLPGPARIGVTRRLLVYEPDLQTCTVIACGKDGANSGASGDNLGKTILGDHGVTEIPFFVVHEDLSSTLIQNRIGGHGERNIVPQQLQVSKATSRLGSAGFPETQCPLTQG